jgi:hypothetical protein
MLEKRKYVRVNEDLMVLAKEDAPRKQHLITLCKDLSENGAKLLIGQRLAVGASVELEINLPYDALPLLAKGRVVWIKEVRQAYDLNEGYNTGIELVELSEYDAARLQKYLDSRIVQENC